MRTTLLLALLAGCSSADLDTPEEELGWCDDQGATRVGVVRMASLGRVVDGVSAGFDLDGRVSESWDLEGCGIEDFVGPDGEEGIDNALGRLMPALEATEAVAIEGLLQDAINSGELLIMPELTELDGDHERDDACVDVGLVRGMGTPSLGTDRRLLAGQTFDRDPDSPPSFVPAAALQGGRLEAGPVQIELPISILDAHVDLVLYDAQVRLDLQEDGGFNGFIGGGVLVSDILDVVNNEGVAQELRDLLTSTLAIAADLAPDESGQCTQLSVVLEFEAVSAFFFED